LEYRQQLRTLQGPNNKISWTIHESTASRPTSCYHNTNATPTTRTITGSKLTIFFQQCEPFPLVPLRQTNSTHTHTTHTHTENSHTESLLTPKNSHSARHTHKAFLRHSKSATHTSRRRAGPDSACQTLTPVVFTATSNENDCWGCFVVACSQPTDERKGGSERAHIFFLFVEKYFGLIPSLGTFRCVYVRLLVVFACVFLCGGVGSLKRPCLRQYLGLCVLVAGRLTL
jgi:hypothetical protein